MFAEAPEHRGFQVAKMVLGLSAARSAASYSLEPSGKLFGPSEPLLFCL